MSSPEATPLHMIRLPLEARRLHALWRRRRLPPHRFDLGYLVHCLLGELFGDLAPRPFSLPYQGAGRGHGPVAGRAATLPVLAYSNHPLAALVDHARAFGDPAAYETVLWDGAAEKPLPEAWPRGRKLGFTVRTCPVVRLGSTRPGRADRRRGVEVDAFVARCWQADEARSAAERASAVKAPVDREAVYRDWLSGQLERRGGARLVRAHLTRFQLESLVRRTQAQERKARDRTRPDAHLSGVLEVTDGGAFARLLAGGVGRHRAFGFGMLLLQPAREA